MTAPIRLRRVTFTWRARENSRFDHNAFDASIGHPLNVVLPHRSAHGTLVGAEVATDGTSVELTVEIEVGPGEDLGLDAILHPGDISIGGDE